MVAFARRLMESFGFGTVDPGFARRGDVALVAGVAPAFAVVGLDGVSLVAVTEPSGMIKVPRAAGLMAWAV